MGSGWGVALHRMWRGDGYGWERCPALSMMPREISPSVVVELGSLGAARGHGLRFHWRVLVMGHGGTAICPHVRIHVPGAVYGVAGGMS
jgi:hypothetical protein